MEEVIFKRNVEIEPDNVRVSIAYNGVYIYSTSVSDEVAKALGLPYERVVSKIEPAIKEFQNRVKEKYGEKVSLDGLAVNLTKFSSIAEVKEFIKFVTETFEETVAKAVKELKKEENFDKLKKWLIKDYVIKL